MLTAGEIQDLMLEATAEVMELFQEVTQEFAHSVAQSNAKVFWQGIPPEDKEVLKREHPQEYEDVRSFVGVR